MINKDSIQNETQSLGESIQALRQDMYRAGFRPIAVYNPDADVVGAGKRPINQGWQLGARENPPRDLAQGILPDALNTGILCDGLQAIDIDVEDSSLASAVEELARLHFGLAPLKYRENSAKRTLLYRASDGEPRKRSRTGTAHSNELSVKVEILGAGNQMVAYGIHPSGVPIEWLDDVAPGVGVSLADLPSITEEQVEAFLKDLDPLIGTSKKEATSEASPCAERPLPPPANDDRDRHADLVDVIAALSAIPNDGPANWEEWKRIGMAVWSATDGSREGYAAFADWSRKNPSHSESAAWRCWSEITASPPSWIGAGTLFFLAGEAAPDWRKPSCIVKLPIEKSGEDADEPATENAVVSSPGFIMTEQGLFHLDNDRDDAEKAKWVSEPFEVLGECSDVESKGGAS
jgi:hypothetical protein